MSSNELMSSNEQNSTKTTVVAVKLRYNPKIYWFDPVLSTYESGDHVLVDTERGREIGLVMDGALEVDSEIIKSFKEPLKPVIRVLSERDYDRIDDLDAKGVKAMPIFRQLIEKHQLEMKPVSVEYLFTGDKAVFYFSNDDRVDFRELVRDLASQFHIRVDMRQIGVRDEARMLGGLAHCGEELCCARIGGEFAPVSIRMAKEQDLPLNPSKISGACGRLMCCLRYEFEAYKDFKGRAPKKGSVIETPLGQAKVVDYDTPREVIALRLEDGKQLSVPLADFECSCDAHGKSVPCRINRETIDRCATTSILMALAALEQDNLPASGQGVDDELGANDKPTRRLRRSRQPVAASGAEAKNKLGQRKFRGHVQDAGDNGKETGRGKDVLNGTASVDSADSADAKNASDDRARAGGKKSKSVGGKFRNRFKQRGHNAEEGAQSNAQSKRDKKRNERNERNERGGQNARNERGERNEHGESGERNRDSNRKDKNERTDKNERSGFAARLDRTKRADRTERVDRTNSANLSKPRPGQNSSGLRASSRTDGDANRVSTDNRQTDNRLTDNRQVGARSQSNGSQGSVQNADAGSGSGGYGDSSSNGYKRRRRRPND